MALTKRIGQGSSLECDPLGGSDFDTIGSIVSGWSGPGGAADEIETTVLSDTFKTFCKGQIDGGEVSMQIAYDPDDTDSQDLVDLYTGCDIATWRANLVSCCSEGTVSETFSGFVKSLSLNVDKGALTVADITIRITGDPGFTGSS